MTIVSTAQRTSLAFSASSVRMASRIESDTWSATLSGWPSVTDSDVNSVRRDKMVLRKGLQTSVA